ncbi:hypothetical protein QTI24_24615 [Variovorax sp. J22P240]|uniref:hypothetical protein n=1 Tax=Variovorax sp. J22P240 TaxID=3053514 RepID=UPI0025788E64|nr:hypothetical protein [Variovorax sp. J22P240]MDM0001814.1 hypothetical protein [Variovorax sp. J22P240]
MAVVINEFEVVDAAPAAARGQDDGAAASPSTPMLPPREDLLRLMAECAEQQLRRFAH